MAQAHGWGSRVVDMSELRPTEGGRAISSQPNSILEAVAKMSEQIDKVTTQAGVDTQSFSSQALIKALLCYVLDLTGSMGPEIEAVNTKFADTIRETHRKFGRKVELRIAFVGYRDVGDSRRFQTLPFTSSATEAMAFVQSLKAEGGADEAEGMVGALEKVLELPWADEDVKLVFHCCDAPGHSRELHYGQAQDSYPNGVPGQRRWQEVPDPRGHISTNTMAARFREAFDGRAATPNPFTILPNMSRYNPEVMFAHIMASLSTTMLKGFTAVFSRLSQTLVEWKRIIDSRGGGRSAHRSTGL